MKVHIRHPNGAQFTGPHRHAEAWWQRFDKAHIESEPEEQPSGSHSYFSGAEQRSYDDYAWGKEVPVIQARKIGFGID